MFFFAPKLLEGKCPVCGEKLYVGKLCCKNCHAEYPVDEGLIPYERLSKEEVDEALIPFKKLSKEELEFLIEFLKRDGNFKALIENLNISYQSAKKKYSELKQKLGFDDTKKPVDLSNYSIDQNSLKPSDIVMRKLKEAGGRVEIPLLGDKTCTIEVKIDSDGNICFVSDKLNNYNYSYKFTVFDIIVDILKRNGGKMAKGNGRSAKVGEKGCTSDTLMGSFAKEYFGKNDGESTYDPIFVFAAVLNWAEIAKNKRGYIELI